MYVKKRGGSLKGSYASQQPLFNYYYYFYYYYYEIVPTQIYAITMVFCAYSFYYLEEVSNYGRHSNQNS
jgi:hypothetical protein